MGFCLNGKRASKPTRTCSGSWGWRSSCAAGCPVAGTGRAGLLLPLGPLVALSAHRCVRQISFLYISFLYFSSLFLYFSYTFLFLFFSFSYTFLFFESRRKGKEKEKTRKAGEKTKKRKAPLLRIYPELTAYRDPVGYDLGSLAHETTLL